MNLKFLRQYAGLFDPYKYKVLLSGRSSGKTRHIINALLYLGSRHQLRIACLREFMTSLDDSSKAEIELAIRESGTSDSWVITRKHITHKVTGTVFTFHGLHYNIESLKGLAQYDIAFIDECETLSQKSWNFLDLTIRKEGSQIWVAGNPRHRTDTIARLFIEQEPPPGSLIIRNSYLDNPLLSADLLEKAEHIKKTDPERYNHELLGQYLDTSKMVLVKHVLMGKTPELASDKTVIGVDIARQGGDRTVTIVRKGKNIVHKAVYPSMELTTLADELRVLSRKYGNPRINIDSTGSGLWVGPGLAVLGVDVREINFASAASDPTQYNNIRTEMYALARKYFDAGGTIPPDAHGLRDELEASYYTYDLQNRIKIVPKDEIRTILGRSPDEADAFCLSLLTEGDMFYDDSPAQQLNNANLAKSVLNSGMF